MFFPRTEDGRKTILIVYIDDIILTGDNLEKIERLNNTLATYQIEKLVSQPKYVLDLLIETRMRRCKPSDIPMETRKNKKR